MKQLLDILDGIVAAINNLSHCAMVTLIAVSALVVAAFALRVVMIALRRIK